jgi:hypothetical protein
MKAAALLVGLAMVGSSARAADDAICAARPGKSTPTCIVPAGHWQIETGVADWSLQKVAGTRQTSLTLGETTFRLGLDDRSEIGADVTPWQRASYRDATVRTVSSGLGDLSLFYKHRLTDGQGPVQAALMPVVKIPTARQPLGNGKVEAALLVPVDVAFGSSPFSLNLTPEIDWAADADGAGHHAAMVQVASLGWQVDAKLSLAGGLWGQWDYDPSGTTRQASADGTIAYLLGKDVQIDAEVDLGLNRNTPRVELSAGISKRF